MAEAFGAFGKIPSLGDFFRLDLPRGFVEPWDAWLQAALLRARESLGEAWNGRYMSAPIWRFSLPAGQAGPQAISGVLMASVDRVGRQYPLTLAATHGAEDLAAAHFRNVSVFEALELIALEALDDGMTREGLRARLDEVAWTPASPVATSFHPGGTTWQSDAPIGPTLAAQKIAEQAHACGFWSTSVESDHRLMLCHGLPNAGQMAGLFDLDAAIWTLLAAEVSR